MMPCLSMLTWAVASLALAGEPPGESVADRVVLRDRSVVLGQVEGLNPQGELVVIARRDWVRENQPERFETWQRLETGAVVEARLQRRRRLQEWRRVRGPTAPPGDRILPWIDREIRAMSDSGPAATSLMRVPVSPSDVASVVRRGAESSRLLRLGWLLPLDGVEQAEPKPLREFLEARNALPANDPAWVSALLPIKSEPEAPWRTRRAVTEALFESDLRFVRFRNFLLPEIGAGPDLGRPAQGVDVPEGPGALANRTAMLDSLNALEAFRSVNGIVPGDEIRLRLAALGSRGRIGAIVSNVDWPVSFEEATAETSLWVRQENGTWATVLTRSARIRRDDPPDPLGPGPMTVSFPIRTTIHVLELFSAAAASPETSRERQQAATMAQRALGRARADLDGALQPFVLPIAAARP